MNENKKKSNKNHAKRGGARRSNRNDRRSDYKQDIEKSSHGSANFDHGSNDPRWYAVNPQLVKDAASLSFNNPVGAPLTQDTFGIAPSENYRAPGFMKISYTPTFGVSEGNESALNLAARRFYSFIRHANSGSRNYDSPDLMLFVLGVLQAFTYWAWMVRLYGLMNNFKFKNRYLPRALVQAMGVSYTDVEKNLAQFRYYINQYAAKLSCVCIPADLTYVKRALWCVTHIWKDANSDYAQMYFMNPTALFVYDEFTENGTALVATAMPANDATLKEITEYGDAMLSHLVESEDVGIMSGDILKAYGDGGIMKISAIPADFTVEAEFSEAVCMQFQNCTCYDFSPIGANITQNPENGAIIYQPVVENQEGIIPSELLLNMRSNDPTPDEVMVATRLSLLVSRGDDDIVRAKACGSELVNGITYYGLDAQGNLDFVQAPSVLGYSSQVPPTMENVIKVLSTAVNFDYHPTLYIVGNNLFTGLFTDIDTATVVSTDALRRMHDTAILSLLNSPGMGSLSIS